MNALLLIVYIFFLHFIGDFVLQRHNDAVNKWHSLSALTNHVIMYGCVLILGLLGVAFLNLQVWLVFLYIALQVSSHWVIDFFTSKLSHRLWEQKRVHDFFVVIGFDQLLHASILIVTTPILLL